MIESCTSPREESCSSTERRLRCFTETRSASNLLGMDGSKTCTSSSSSRKTHFKEKEIHADLKKEEGNSTAVFIRKSVSLRFNHSRCLGQFFVFFLLLSFLYQQTPEQEGAPSTLNLWFDWGKIKQQFVSNLSVGILSASAALCADNICVNGTCYETGGLKTCVCDLPFTGALCDTTVSLCSDGCGIRTSTGIDCSSALCSLGTCVDTNTAPYFRCECGDFFTGTNCETHNNPCTNPAANPCGEGTCTFAPGKGSGTVTCTCNEDYEAATGAGMTTMKWGDSEIIQGPPCTVRKSRGIAKLNFSLTSGQLVMWWAIFATAILVLAWCCYAVCSENCSNWAMAWKAAKVVKG